MALRREDRYATATLLAAEIEQYLADEPVKAYPEPAAVRAKRWARKHPVWVASLAASLLVGAIGLGSGLYFVNAEKDRTEAQRLVAVDFGQKANDAKLQAQQANELTKKRLAQIEKGNELITSIFTDLTPDEVKDSAEPLEAILAKKLVLASEQLKGESVGDPLAVAKLQLQLGESLVSLGYPIPAIDLFQEARTTFTKHVGADHPDTLKSVASLSAGYQHAGNWDVALPLLEDTLQRRRIKLGPEHADTLQSMDALAKCYTRLGKFDFAMPTLVHKS